MYPFRFNGNIGNVLQYFKSLFLLNFDFWINKGKLISVKDSMSFHIVYTLWHRFLQEAIAQRIFLSFDFNGTRAFWVFTQSSNQPLNSILMAREESGDALILSIKVEMHQTLSEETINCPLGQPF